MWEQFSYYGMRALLTLYLTKHFIFGDRQATGLYGGYTALVYLTPLIGGLIAEVGDGLRHNGEAGDGQVEASVRARVEALTARFPIYPGR